jgi:hypothetical protein
MRRHAESAGLPGILFRGNRPLFWSSVGKWQFQKAEPV